MKKLPKIFLYAALLISVVLTVLYYMNGTEAGTLACDTWTVWYLNWGYVLVALALLLVVLLPLFNIGNGGGNLKKSILIIVGFVALMALSWFLASPAAPVVTIETMPSAQTIKITDAGLIFTYILVALAILSIFAGSVVNSLRNKQN